MNMITDPYRVLDLLGGGPSHDYQKDLAYCQVNFQCTFLINTYIEALQLLTQS